MSFIAGLLKSALPGLVKPLLPYLLCLTIGAGGGAFAVWRFFPRIVEVPQTREVEKIVQIPVKGETETRIQYIERAADDAAQVKIDTAPPRVVAEINGRQFGFDSVAGEKYAFEKGQLVIKQESSSTIDLTAWANRELTIERERIKKEFYKPRGVGVAALSGVSQSYVGIEYDHKAFAVGGYRSTRGGGDKYLIKAGWRWRF